MRSVPHLRRLSRVPRVDPSTLPSDPRLPSSGLWGPSSLPRASTLIRLAASRRSSLRLLALHPGNPPGGRRAPPPVTHPLAAPPHVTPTLAAPPHVTPHGGHLSRPGHLSRRAGGHAWHRLGGQRGPRGRAGPPVGGPAGGADLHHTPPSKCTLHVNPHREVWSSCEPSCEPAAAREPTFV